MDMLAAAYDSFSAQFISSVELLLENQKRAFELTPSQKGDGGAMAAKINRAVEILGRKHWIRANTEQEYVDKVIAIYTAGSDRIEAPAAKNEFAQYAMNWYRLYALPSIATATAKTYERQLKRHLIPFFGEMAVEDIKTDTVQCFFNSMPGTKATKDKAKMVLNMILTAATEDGLLLKNPLKSTRLKITGASSKATKPYSVLQMQQIVESIPKVKSPSDRVYIALQALHPLRLEEVLGLKWEDIDTANQILHIRRAVTHPDRNLPEVKETKTQASVRDIPLSSIALKYMTPGKPGEFVCGGSSPLSYTQVRRMCNRIKADMGFDENITPIRFRTTVLTDIYDKTKDIKQTQAAAGHTTSDMTLKYYVKGRSIDSDITASVIDSTYGSAAK